MAMTTVRRGLLGGVGALLPVSVSLLAVDLPKTFEHISALVILGWAVKAVVLFFLGALVAGLHRDERSPLKLLELGIVAPALITTLVNGAQVDRNRVSALPSLAAVAHAAAPGPAPAAVVQAGPETPWQQFLRGVFGGRPAREGLEPDALAVTERLKQPGRDFGNWDWEVYVTGPAAVIGGIECVEYVVRDRRERECERGDPARPFAHAGRGTGTVDIAVRVRFKDGRVRDLRHRVTVPSG